jgi:hypothetical protein
MHTLDFGDVYKTERDEWAKGEREEDIKQKFSLTDTQRGPLNQLFHGG